MKTYVLNKNARSQKLDDMFSMVTEKLMREFNQDIVEDLGFEPETENPDMEIPEDIEEFFSSDYKTESEETADLVLTFVMEVKKQKEKLKNLMLDFLVQDDVIAYVDEEYGTPVINKANVLETEFDWDPEKEIQDDPQYIIHNKFLSYNEILNNWDLSEEEIQKIKDYTSINNGNLNELGYGGYESLSSYSAWFRNDDNILRIRCVEMRWISKRRVRVQETINQHTGKKIFKILSDDDKPSKKRTVKTDYIDYVRKCIMVGPDVLLESGPETERYSRVDNPKKDTILAVGLRRQNTNGINTIRSAAKKLSQLQDFASEILWEIRLAMRRNNGRVLVYDAAQTPKHFLKGGYENAINRVMHHAKKDQFLIINSQDRNSRYAFNQFTSLDMSTKGLMTDLFNTLGLVEDLASKFIGISPQREGNIQQYETVQGSERSVAQSTARTEIYFNPFESFVQVLMERILMKSKNVFQEGDIVDFVFGDIKSEFFKIFPSFHTDDFGVYIGNSAKEQRKKQVIDRAAEIALGNAQTPELILQLTEVLNADFSSEAEKILKRGIKALEQIRQENNEAMQQAEQTRQDGENQRQAEDLQVKREGYDKDRDVAKIYVQGKALSDNQKTQADKIIKAAELEQQYINAQNQQNVSNSQKKQ